MKIADESPLRQSLALINARIRSTPEGTTQTSIPFLKINRRSEPTPHTKAILQPSFCLIVQGGKKILFDRGVIRYGPGDFAASVIDMPAAGQISQASASEPYLGLRIDFTQDEIAAVVAEARLEVKRPARAPGAAAFVGKATPEILELLLRMLTLAEAREPSDFVAHLVKRELIFRLLTGPHAHLFFQRMLFDPKADGVGTAIEWIRSNFASPMKIEKLARLAGVSVSAFHHKFKAVTTMGPLQYQKQLRLLEARRLMLAHRMEASTAAFEVGYESASQFNREYKRYFGQPPLRDIEALRGKAFES